MSTTGNEVVSSAPLSESVYRILAGPAMDKLLIRCLLRIIAGLVEGKRVLDIGVGLAELTWAILDAGAGEIVATDMDQRTIDRAHASWRKKGRPVERVQWLVHNANDPMPDELGLFDLIVYSSVAMHQTPEQSERTIRDLMTKLAPGGVLIVVVVSSDFAQDNFIRASGTGTPMYYPRTVGMTRDTTESDLDQFQRQAGHKEYYPPDTHYDRCCCCDGYDTEISLGVVHEEFEGTIYADCKGQTYWNFWIVTRRS